MVLDGMGLAPNEILGHNDYKKPLIDITKHTKDNIEEPITIILTENG